MKRVRLAATVLFLFAALDAYGASLEYSPGAVYLTVPAGTEQSTPLTVSLLNPSPGTYYLWFVSSVDGTLPPEWISPSPSTSFVSRYWSSASTALNIGVPDGAEPGVYSAYIFAKAMTTHYYADPGRGFYVEVTVPSSCNGKPEVVIDGFGPDLLWPPNGSMEEVRVTGTVVAPSGCNIYEVGYSVDDEYGVYTGVGTVAVGGGGEFSVPIPVEASRAGQDKDGRRYTITIYAEDEAGITTTEALQVLVPHDQRK
jgi:hypothetical protein